MKKSKNFDLDFFCYKCRKDLFSKWKVRHPIVIGKQMPRGWQRTSASRVVSSNIQVFLNHSSKGKENTLPLVREETKPGVISICSFPISTFPSPSSSSLCSLTSNNLPSYNSSQASNDASIQREGSVVSSVRSKLVTDKKNCATINYDF